MSISAKIVAHSISEAGKEIVTYEVQFPRIVLAEVNTHRALSKNTSSSRAVSIKKQISHVWNDPFIPVYWGKNKAGMGAAEELTGWRLMAAKTAWKLGGKASCLLAYFLNWVGLHKQITNRCNENWSYTKMVITGTEWDNFFHLRIHKDAQPEIQELAKCMRDALRGSKPKLLKKGEWHLPYIDDELRATYCLEDLKTLSVSLCAQVSYRNSDFSLDKAKKIVDKLINGERAHSSCFEHLATPLDDPKENSGNFKGFLQYRQTIPGNVCTKYNYHD